MNRVFCVVSVCISVVCLGAFATQVEVVNDHGHGFYYPGQVMKLTVTVTDDDGGKLGKGIVRASLDDCEGNFLVPETPFNLADANSFVITGKLDRAGIAHLKLSSADIADFPKRPGAPYWIEAIHVNPQAIRMTEQPPADFNDHWKKLAETLPRTERSGTNETSLRPGRLVLLSKDGSSPAAGSAKDSGIKTDTEIVKTVVVDEAALSDPKARQDAILSCLSAANQLAADPGVDPEKIWFEGEGAAGGLGFAVIALSGKFTRAVILSPEISSCGDQFLDDRFFAKSVKCPISVAFGDIDHISSPSRVYAVCAAIPSYDSNIHLLKGAGHSVPDDTRAKLADWLANPPESTRLWPESMIPDYRNFQTMPEMEWYAPTNRKSKVCIIIAPGGGYSGIAYQHEGLRTARNFLDLGMHVVVLRYRTPPSGIGPMHHSARQDAQRCVRIVRSQAAKRGYDPERIGMTGFSAGGHLTCVTACNSQTPAYEPVDDIDNIPCHLNFAAPVYPAYLLKYGSIRLPPRGEEVDCPFTDDLDFDAKTPPMCFIHGDDDGHSAVGSIRAYEKLRRMKIRGEMHIFSGVNHGFGGSVRHGWQPSGWEIQVANFVATLGMIQRTDAFRWPGE